MEQSVLTTFPVRKSNRLSTHIKKFMTPDGSKSDVKYYEKLVSVSASETRESKLKDISVIKNLLVRESTNSSPICSPQKSDWNELLSSKSSANKECISSLSLDSASKILPKDTTPKRLSGAVLSPKKRKPVDENEADDESHSPVKSSRAYKTPIPSRKSPPTPRSSRIATPACRSTPRRLFGSPEENTRGNLADVLLNNKTETNLSSKIKSPLKLEPVQLFKEEDALSPQKRKVVDENKSDTESVSPIKTSRGHRTPISNRGLPSTPRSSRIVTSECKSTPRRLFASPQKSESMAMQLLKQNCETNLTPQKNSPRKLKPVQLYKQNVLPYLSAKRSLHTATPDFLVGRDSEEKQIESFIEARITKRKSGSLYISGAPGTGKTAVVTHVLDRIKFHHSDIKAASMNCMMVKDSNTVFRHILEQFGESAANTKDAHKMVEQFLTSLKKSVILVLDEIDQLDSKDHHILYEIFEWPALKGSKLILIGIANALDLTDRILPRLQGSACRPELLNFPAYTTSQITEIIKKRLENDSVLESSAINFCARKISAVAGDARKALNVCHRAIELMESDIRSQQILKPTDCNSPTKQQTPVQKVTISHISKVLSEVYSSGLTSANNSESELPLQHKLAICSLLVLVKRGKFKEVLLGKLHETYASVCKRQQLAPVDQSEFHSVLSLLDARGVLTMKKAKETRLIKIALKLDELELEQTLKDKILLASILNDK